MNVFKICIFHRIVFFSYYNITKNLKAIFKILKCLFRNDKLIFIFKSHSIHFHFHITEIFLNIYLMCKLIDD